MSDVSRKIRLDADPDAVWAVVGDPVKVGEWLPMIAAARMEGDLRIASVSGRDATIVERILEHSDAERYYTYEVVDGPMGLESYHSKLSVEADGDGAVVAWVADFEPPPGRDKEEVAKGIDGTYEAGLDALKEVIGG